MFLEQVKGQPEPPGQVAANLRIMVPDVDAYWRIAQKMRPRVIQPLEDRDYGLRDFMVVSPDGLGLRFASRV